MSATIDHRKLDGAVAGGLAWTAGAKSTTQFFTWLSALVAARLLSPDDFGLVGMAGFFSNITVMLAEFGLGTAVLQMPELESDVIAQLNTASVAICSLAFGLAALVAPLIAIFFKSDQLRLLVIVNATGLIFMGFQSVPMGLLEKDLDYRRISIAEAIQAAVMASVTITFALMGFAYWSLIAGPAAGRLTSAILTSWWKPAGFRIPRWNQVQAPLRLGMHVAVGRLASGIYALSDGVIVGRMLGSAALGTYQMAMTLASAPADKVGLLIMRVTGPLFARIQGNKESVRRYFQIVSEGLALSVLPMMFGLAVVAPEALRIVLGPKWSAAAGPIRWLALFIGLRTLSTLVNQVLTSLRHTRFTMWLSLFSFLLMPTAFWVAARWGTSAVAASWIVLSPLTILPLIVKLLRTIDLRYRDFLNAMVPALAGSAAMVAALLAWRTWGGGDQMRASFKLTIEIAAGGAVYGGFLLGFYRRRLERYFRFVQGLRKGATELVTDNP